MCVCVPVCEREIVCVFEKRWKQNKNIFFFKKRRRKWDRRIVPQRGGDWVFFASCEVVTAPTDNNISNISLSAISTSSMNRFLSVGGRGLFVPQISQPNTVAAKLACTIVARKWSSDSTSQTPNCAFFLQWRLFSLCVTVIYGKGVSALALFWVCLHSYKFMVEGNLAAGLNRFQSWNLTLIHLANLL